MKSRAACEELLVDRLHALLGQRAGVLDSLLADTSVMGMLGGIVLIGRPGVQDSPWPESLFEVRESLRVRVIGVLRLLFGIQVIEVAEELVEAVHGG